MDRTFLSTVALLTALTSGASAQAAADMPKSLNFVCEVNGLMPNGGDGPTVYAPDAGLLKFAIDLNQKSQATKGSLGWSETKAVLKGRDGYAFEMAIALDAYKGLTTTGVIKKNGVTLAKNTVPFAGEAASLASSALLETAQASILINCVARPQSDR